MLSKLLTRKEQLVLLAVSASLLAGSVTLFIVGKGPEHDPKPSASGMPLTPAVNADPVAPLIREAIRTALAPVIVEESTAPADPIADYTLYVRGAVQRPGAYAVPHDGRVQDLIALAGGATNDADVSDINLVAALMDSSTLTIPMGPTRIRQGRSFVLRGGESAAALNPAEYTLSGWLPSSTAREAGQSAVVAGAGGVASSGLINLNRATAKELEALPGIGPKLAADIVAFRQKQPFGSIEDLQLVSGIGPKRLEAVLDLVTVGGSR